LPESRNSLPLYRVFHSIRFKVNKGWVRALTLFLCPTVKPKKNRTLQSRVSALSALHVTTSPTIKYKPTENGKKNLLQTIFQSPANDFSFGAEQKIICRKVNPTTPRDMISFDKALLPKSGTPTHGMHFAALPVRSILQKK